MVRNIHFDLIIKNKDKYIAYIQSLIHTSDPGQYGVNKSDETILIKQELTSVNHKTKETRELWGLVDGVGFTENKTNTIDKMLEEFDTFLQLKSIYKSALRLHKLGLIKVSAICFDSSFYSEDEAKEMFDKYGSIDIDFYYGKEPEIFKTKVIGGVATIFLN